MSESMEGKTAMELLSMGTKAYWLRKYQDAATYLSKSSEMLVAEHKDDKHNSLGNVYLYYGKSLLELAREEGDPLGDGCPKEVGMVDPDANGEGEDDDGDSDTDGEEGEGDKEKEGKKVEKEKAEKETVEKENGDNETKVKEKVETESDEKAMETDTPEATKEDASPKKASPEKAAAGKDDSQGSIDDEDTEEDAGEGGSEEKEEDEEPTDLQLAWEVLELSKIIFERRGEQGREDYSDCLVTLGEISLESENFESAIADIKAGLAIQKEIYTDTKDMRKLAQTYYKLGMALTANNAFDDGIEHYTTTMQILRERLTVLQGSTDIGVSDAEEIKEIQVLLPELEEKIQDLKTYKEEAAKRGEDEPVLSSPEKKATNIGHLVKRKRKIDEICDAGGEASKEPKKVAV